jgi:MSHA pilin protein MshD
MVMRISKINRVAGFTYVEVMMAAVILSVLLVSALTLFGNLGRSRGAAMVTDKANTLVLDLMQEILQQSYSDPASAVEFGPGADETGTSRANFDDVDDYHGLQEMPPKDKDGNDLSEYANITQQVAVRHVQAADFTLAAVADQGYKEVTITITAGGEPALVRNYVIANASF